MANLFPRENFGEVWSTMQEFLRTTLMSSVGVGESQVSWLAKDRDLRNRLLGEPDALALDSYMTLVGDFDLDKSIQSNIIQYLKYCLTPASAALVSKITETPVDGFPITVEEFNCSAATLSDMYNAARILESLYGAGHSTIVELGGRYGNMARIFKQIYPQSTYVIIDTPEALCVQLMFLLFAVPDLDIKFHFELEEKEPLRVGAINLMPLHLAFIYKFTTDLFFSFPSSEEPILGVQQEFALREFFGADLTMFLTGVRFSENMSEHQEFQSLLKALNKFYNYVNVRPTIGSDEYRAVYEISAARPVTT